MSKKLATTIIAILTVAAAAVTGSVSVPDAVAQIGVLAIAYAAIEGAVDIARARVLIRTAHGVVRVVDAALTEAERTLDGTPTAPTP